MSNNSNYKTEEQKESEIESQLVEEILSEFRRIGIDTSNWEYEFGDGNFAHEFIAAGVQSHIEALQSRIKELEQRKFVPTIDEQIEAIKKATEEACKSPEAARKFLIDAGILTEEPPKELEQQSGLRWVKASERLPDDYRTVFFKCPMGFDNEYHVGFYNPKTQVFYSNKVHDVFPSFESIKWLEELEQQLHCKDDLVTGAGKEGDSDGHPWKTNTKGDS
jgi:hypothetical protein